METKLTEQGMLARHQAELAQGRFLIQRCDGCAGHIYFPREVCPHCGSTDPHYFLTPQGEGRKTRTGTVSVRRVWKCKSCRKQFSVTTGTIFHGTRV